MMLDIVMKKAVYDICDHIVKNDKERLGLYNGLFGQILFLVYYNLYYGEETCADRIENCIETVLKKIVPFGESLSYSDGLAGEIVFIDFIKKQNIIDFDISPIRDRVDSLLLKEMRKCMELDYYDFMHGGLGVCLYFLKSKSKLHKKYSREFVDYLYEAADKDVTNLSFKWESYLFYKEPAKGYNLSMSHGMSSLIIFLSQVYRLNINRKKVRQMLVGAVNYILSKELAFSKFGFSFPSIIFKDSEDTLVKSRLGWCYGDLGIAVALWQAGKALNRMCWKEKAVEVLEKCIDQRKYKRSGVDEAGICHGTAGICLIFRRMYLETGNPQFDREASYWFDETLSYLENQKNSISNLHDTDYTLLTGISGLFLVLLSAANKDIQAWDTMFLLS